MVRFGSLLAVAVVGACAPAAHAATTDLAIWQLSSSHPRGVPLGGTITYTYDIRNLGPSASGAVLIDTLGYGEALVSASASRGTCTQVAPVTCSLGEAPSSGGWLVTVVTRADKPGTVTHAGIVRAAAGSTNSNVTNDLGTVTTPVAGSTDRVGVIAATTDVRSTTQTRMVLGGRVGPNGDGTYYFEYGATQAYGRRTPVRTVDTNRYLEVEARVSGLKLNSTYHYRLVLVVEGKAYRGRDAIAQTDAGTYPDDVVIKARALSANSARYSGKLVRPSIADSPLACTGSVELVFSTVRKTILKRRTRVRRDCTYALTVPFGSATARRHGREGEVAVQWDFKGNRSLLPWTSSPLYP